MLLIVFDNPAQSLDFDPLSGAVSRRRMAARAEDVNAGGDYKDLDDGTAAAIFSAGDLLVLQIGHIQWNLFDPSVCMAYSHTVSAVTTFEITASKGEAFTAQYESWWRGDFDTHPAIFNDEYQDEDAIHDFFGWVYILWKNKEAAINVHRRWSENQESFSGSNTLK